MRSLAIALILAASPAAVPAAQNASLIAQLEGTKLHAAPQFAALTTSEQALDYVRRLTDDVERLEIPDTPYGYGAAEWQNSAQTVAQLDEELAQQLLSGKRLPFETKPGVYARFIISSADKSWQPVAIFVPASYGKGAAPLAVLLHGHPQTETELLGLQMLRDLAERTGSVVVAPYGRGYYDFHGVASTDVDDAVAAAAQFYRTDDKRRFLVGYSMGGFSVFEVAQRNHVSWRAIMCVSGALLGHDAATVRQNSGSTQYYFVTGADDESIPTKYTQTSAAYLDSAGIPTSLYVEPSGHHRLATLRKSLTEAWVDMFSGTQRGIPDASRGLALGALPGAVPVSSTKP